MAFDERVADRIRQVVGQLAPEYAEQRMFGGPSMGRTDALNYSEHPWWTGRCRAAWWGSG